MNNDIQESAGRTWVRLALFILIFIVAVWSISNGILQLLAKHPGYYEIKVDPDDNVPYFRNGISLYAWLEGSDDQIKLQQRNLTATYRQMLLRTYQLFDTDTEYPGLANLATLNHHIDEAIAVPPDLFAVISDMWEKTQTGSVVNLFAGAVIAEVDSILSLSDISGFEPDPSTEYGIRIAQLAERTSDLSQFALDLDPEHLTVTVHISDTYRAYLAEIECPYPIISLGRMEDAYRLDLIRTAVESSGFSNGFVTADSGLTVSLCGHKDSEYVVYTEQYGIPVPYETLPGGNTTAFSYVHAFPLHEQQFMYHAAENGWLHPVYSIKNGTWSPLIKASGIVASDGDVIRCAYENLELHTLVSVEDIQRFIDTGSDSVSLVYY